MRKCAKQIEEDDDGKERHEMRKQREERSKRVITLN